MKSFPFDALTSLSSDGSHRAGWGDILQSIVVKREVRIVTDSSQAIGEAVIKVEAATTVVAMDIPATLVVEATDRMEVVVAPMVVEVTAVVPGAIACPTWALV